MTLTRVRAPHHEVIEELAQRTAMHPRMEAAVMGAVRATLPDVLEGVLRDMFAGENVRLWVPKVSRRVAHERDVRIAAALSAGEAQSVIAKRENVSTRHVERINARRKAPPKTA